MDFQVVAVFAGNREGHDHARVGEGDAGVGLVGAGAVVNLIVVFAFVKAELEEPILVVVGWRIVAVAGAPGEADGAGRRIVGLELGIADRERLGKGAEGDGLLEAGAVGVEAPGFVVFRDAVEVLVVCGRWR